MPEYRSDRTESNLSVAQQHVWSRDHRTAQPPHIVTAFEIHGEIDAGTLQHSLAAVVRRQEMLRSYFLELDGNPVRLVARRLTAAVRVIDLSALPETARSAELAHQLTLDSSRPIVPRSAPLFRVALVHLGDRNNVLSLVLHRLIADEFSPTIFLTELADTYACLRRGQPVPAQRPVRFAEIVAEERQWLLNDAGRQQLDHWTSGLAGARPLELPVETSDPEQLTGHGHLCRSDLPVDLLHRLGTITGTDQPECSILAGFTVLLSRMTGQTDVSVGFLTPNRDNSGTARLIGPLANPLVIRTDLAGNPIVREAFRRVRSAREVALAHSQVSFRQIAHVAACDDLVRIMVVFEEQPNSLRLDDCAITPLAPEPTVSRLLTLRCTMSADGVSVRLEYDTRLLSAGAAYRLMARFRTVLEAAAATPDEPVSQLPVLPADETRLLLRKWAIGPTAEIPVNYVHELVEAAVGDDPDAVAVVFEDRELTYRQLNHRANQLAHALRAKGIGPDDRVAVCLPRGLDLPVALLAVLKAGAAYVPLDPAYPAGRLAFMIADSGARVLLTCNDLTDRVPTRPGRTMVLDRDSQQIEEFPAANPPPLAHPDNLAYVLYTSGSTGAPKGVAVSHRGLANYVTWASTAYRLKDGRGSTLHSSIAFDLSVTSMYPALASGRTVMLTREDDAGIGSLAEVLREGGHSLVKLTPAHLELLCDSLTAEQASSAARRLVVGGEALSGQLLRQWARLAPGMMVVNEFGPTETVVGCCVYEIAAGHAPPGPVPIGRPIQNTRLYVLDDQLRLAPIGTAGELYIGGLGVARGYLGRPARTAERFVPDPFGAPGDRLYRTGDLVRYLPDGRLDYLGRTDDQVKIRGHRIELGEIESTLVRHQNVRAAVVLAREDSPGDRRLVAYVVAHKEPAPTAEQLGEHLGRTLPAYMLPAHYVELPRLPLTHNGKVDRAALPVPGARQALPRTEVAAGRPDLATEALVEDEITPAGLPIADVLCPQHVFITGVTGFVGAFVMDEILRTSEADVHCLIRAGSADEAFERLESTLRSYRIWDEAYRSRLVMVPGNLEEPRFGLSPELFDQLAATIDAIYHCGAKVNFVYPYSALKRANVLGTKEILKLACRVRAKAVHHLSTIDIFMHGDDRLIREDHAIDPADVRGGYDQSKWVAEQLIATVRDRGLPAVIYRPWTILGHSVTGVAQPKDYACVLLKGCIQLGAAPGHDMSLNFMPVDFVSRAIVHLSRQRESFGQAFHFANPRVVSLRDAWEWVSKFGYEFDVVSYEEWRGKLRGVGPGNALYPVVPLLTREDVIDPRNLPEETTPRISTSNTDAALAGAGIECPPLDGELGRKILANLVRIGFIEPPT